MAFETDVYSKLKVGYKAYYRPGEYAWQLSDYDELHDNFNLIKLHKFLNWSKQPR